jgi:hypothetical protein
LIPEGGGYFVVWRLQRHPNTLADKITADLGREAKIGVPDAAALVNVSCVHLCDFLDIFLRFCHNLVTRGPVGFITHGNYNSYINWWRREEANPYCLTLCNYSRLRNFKIPCG